MPIYEYRCEECEREIEVLQRIDEPPLAECPHCGGPVRKLISAPAFQFKGSGWYVTDYARKGGGSEKESGGEASAGKEGRKESAAAKGDGKGDKADKADKPAKAAKASGD